MSDTKRTLSELQTLLANNSTGNISAQDLRDLLVSSMQTNQVTEVDSATYDVLSDDNLIHVTRTLIGSCTITIPYLPNDNGRQFEVVDGGGNAGTNKIAVEVESPGLMYGLFSGVDINTDHNAISLYLFSGNAYIR